MGTNQEIGFSHTRYASDQDLEKLGALGTRSRVDGDEFQLVQVATALVNDVIAAGEVLYRTSTEYEVTNDVSASLTGNASSVCGVAPSDLSASVPESTATRTYYMAMQVGGINDAIVTNGDDDITAGLQLVAVGDGTCDSAAASTAIDDEYIGQALAADVDADNTVKGTILLKGW